MPTGYVHIISNSSDFISQMVTWKYYAYKKIRKNCFDRWSINAYDPLNKMSPMLKDELIESD